MDKIGYTYDEERELNTIDFEEAYKLLKEQVKKDNHILGCDCSKKDKEIERLRKREKKWEKWTTEKEILSTKMSEYLCKWKNIKREYKNQVESNRLKKQKIERLNNIINELEKYLEERIKSVPETMAEVYEDTNILNKLKELKEGK